MTRPRSPPSHGSVAFTAVWYEGKARKRKVFNELHLAETHATTKVTSQARGELDILHPTGEERLAYVRSREALAEFRLAVAPPRSNTAMPNACCAARRSAGWTGRR